MNVRLVVCINEYFGIGQPSCVASGNFDSIQKIRAPIRSEGLNVSIVEQVRLGKREKGPIMRIAPGGKFFTQIDSNVLPTIIEELEFFLAKAVR